MQNWPGREKNTKLTRPSRRPQQSSIDCFKFISATGGDHRTALSRCVRTPAAGSGWPTGARRDRQECLRWSSSRGAVDARDDQPAWRGLVREARFDTLGVTVVLSPFFSSASAFLCILNRTCHSTLLFFLSPLALEILARMRFLRGNDSFIRL